MPTISNVTYEQMTIGQSASVSKQLTEKEIESFAVLTGDTNPAHVDEDYAKNEMFGGIIAHGMWGASLISAVLGTKLPGPGTIYLEQSLKFRKPVMANDTLTATVTVKEMNDEKGIVILESTCENQHGDTVIKGEAKILAPKTEFSKEQVQLGEVQLIKH